MSEHHLTPQSPLMHPVEHLGQIFLTAQFFHRQYVENTSQDTGKYRRYDAFLRLLRSIETYQNHKSLGNVIEIEFARIKTEPTPNMVQWKSLFQATGYHPITLLNATAQMALTHHLDDEFSKMLSVAANTATARQMTGGALRPHEAAARDLAACLEIARLLQTPEHIAQQEAAKQIEASTGVNIRAFLSAAPAQNQIAPADEMLEPAELAKRLNMVSGYAVNIGLEKLGWQVKIIGGEWEATTAGLPYASRHAWTAKQGTKSGYNWKWKLEAVRRAFGM